MPFPDVQSLCPAQADGGLITSPGQQATYQGLQSTLSGQDTMGQWVPSRLGKRGCGG